MFLLLAITAQAQAPSIAYQGPHVYTVGTAITTLTPTGSGGTVSGSFCSGSIATESGTGGAGSLDQYDSWSPTYNFPMGLVLLNNDPDYIVADGNNSKLRSRDRDNNSIFSRIQTYAAGGGLSKPFGMARASSGDIYVADTAAHKIFKVSTSGTITTFAGSGTSGSTNATGASASFNRPMTVALNPAGTILYVVDKGNNLIRQIDIATGAVTNFTVSGITLVNPTGIAVDVSGNLYVSDNHRILKITSSGTGSVLAGSGTEGAADANTTSASFNEPYGLAVDLSGNVFVADKGNNKIRVVTSTGDVVTIGGNSNNSSGTAEGVNTASGFNKPYSLVLNSSGSTLIIADAGNIK